MKYFAGIGSREVPKSYIKPMQMIATAMFNKGYVLRSGGANGSDSIFEEVYKLNNGKMEIFLPWGSFNGRIVDNESYFIPLNKKAEEIASEFHPRYQYLKSGAKKMMIRNSCQVFGVDMSTPSNLIICYTDKGEDKGGTSQAIRIARFYNIPIFNVGKCKPNEVLEKFQIFMEKHNA